VEGDAVPSRISVTNEEASPRRQHREYCIAEHCGNVVMFEKLLLIHSINRYSYPSHYLHSTATAQRDCEGA
jgi:hypothetical protein